MLSTVRQIGNSRGILIPAAFLASCEIDDRVDMRLHDGSIVIKAVKRTLREGWYKTGVGAAALQDKSATDWDSVSIAADSEWQW